MIVRFVMLTIGFGLAAAGGISVIAYLNYIPAGLTIIEYILFIFQRSEGALLVLGLLLITGSIYWPEKS
ncbi:hypothetical protein D7Z54_23060 [Salibacterium salarium]|uniref:Uncharacterized protein n=1 Tax=Salibacterium salarium TaxID=284579 RepID=A0A428MXZ6_9BACI|nr:hypothetical protein [Salibacterium salarium]RSL31028.1 hypothetical protein D7Z54_23060 [Salibacterium salarium]